MIALYRWLTVVAYPLIGFYLRRRLTKGKEHPERLPERFGRASLPRPEGMVVWLHGASVGESLALLPLAKSLSRKLPDATLLITSGTVTSAELLATRMPQGWIHQFAPVDALPAVTAFLDHWQPDIAIWVESELWPNLILETHRRGVPMALVNGRLSEKSFQTWRRFPQTARRLLGAFRLISPQRAEDGIHFAALDASNILGPLNLKLAAEPLPVDDAEAKQLADAIGARPVWLAASTHANEEAIVLRAHHALKGTFPELLTVLAPRHPNRGGEVRALLEEGRLTVAQRSRGEAITAQTDIYLADTLGELGTLFAVAPVVFVGGSFVPVGGHNPLEPARAGCAVLHGPLVDNFSDVYTAMDHADATLGVADESRLATTVKSLLEDPRRREELGEAARRYAAQGVGSLTTLTERIIKEVAYAPHS